MKHAIYDHKPSAIEAVGNGSYLYRWGIEEITTAMIDLDEYYTKWQCYEVVVSSTPNANNILAQVVDTIWGGGVEQKLLNDYQAALLGVLDEEYTTPYLEFLAQRKAIKAQIEIDVAANN